MRIFMFASRYPVPYKPYYDNQFVDLLRRGHELTIFSRGALDPDTINEKVARYDLDERTKRYPGYLSNVPAAFPSYVSGGLARPLSSLRAARRIWNGSDERPVRVRVRELARMLAVNAGDPDLCFVHGLGTATHFRWLTHAFPGAVIAMFYHGGEVPEIPDLDDDQASTTFEAFDVVFTNTRFSAQQAERRGCSPEKLQILPVGFDIEDFSPPPERVESGNAPLRLLSAGRISEEKGIVFALRAIERFLERGKTGLEYEIAGDGYRRDELERFVHRHGLEEHVRFVGVLSTREVLEAMHRSNVLLLPSITIGNSAETQASSVQEAMLKRCLVVTTQIGGVPESIPECMRPYCVPERDPGALCDAIAAIHEMPPERREDLADECRAFVVENYDIRKLNDRMLAAIEQVARSGRVRTREHTVPSGGGSYR